MVQENNEHSSLKETKVFIKVETVAGSLKTNEVWMIYLEECHHFINKQNSLNCMEKDLTRTVTTAVSDT